MAACLNMRETVCMNMLIKLIPQDMCPEIHICTVDGAAFGPNTMLYSIDTVFINHTQSHNLENLEERNWTTDVIIVLTLQQ